MGSIHILLCCSVLSTHYKDKCTANLAVQHLRSEIQNRTRPKNLKATHVD